MLGVRRLKQLGLVCIIAGAACNPRYGAPLDLGGMRGDLAAAPDLASAATVTLRSASTGVLARGPTLVVARPPMVASGDLLLAHLTLGFAGNTVPPVVTPPPGWTLLDRLDRSAYDAMLAVYWRVADASEPAQYAWMTSELLAGCAWIGAFAGVSSTRPFDVKQGFIDNTAATMYTTGTVTTRAVNAFVIVTFAAHDMTTGPTKWTVPSGVTELENFNNQGARSMFSGAVLAEQPGTVGPFTAATSPQTEAYALMYLLALSP